MNTYLGEGRMPSEKNDCTVISLSYAFDLPYEIAHKICKSCGRKDKGRFYLNKVFRIQERRRIVKRKLAGNKYEIIFYPRPHMTIKSFIKSRPSGKFICTVANHSFCIKDSVIFNQRNENQIIKYLFEIVKL